MTIEKLTFKDADRLGIRTYEVAVIVGYNSNDWTLADNRPKKIPSDEWPVFAHLNEEDVDSLMERVSNFEPPF